MTRGQKIVVGWVSDARIPESKLTELMQQIDIALTEEREETARAIHTAAFDAIAVIIRARNDQP